MTENIPQTSASERVEAAQKALADWDAAVNQHGAAALTARGHMEMVAALRALTTPPAVGESEVSIAERIADEAGIDWDEAYDVALLAVRAAIQSAHESWEPADVPSQEFMLRHLGIDYSDDVDHQDRPTFAIRRQYIEQEVD